MSHPEQRRFFELCAESTQILFPSPRVIEIGSFDVNGTIRSLFAHPSTYVGVDLTPGPGVDLVAYGHLVDHPAGSYDVAISGECFEHDPHWRETFLNMHRMTRPGGLVIFTCASRGRPEHGTTRTDPTLSPGTQAKGHNYYRNLTEADFVGCMDFDRMFASYRFYSCRTSMDLYFIGQITGGTGARAQFPDSDDIRAIEQLMSPAKRLAYAPMRILSERVSDDNRYQDLIMPYWKLLLRLRSVVAKAD